MARQPFLHDLAVTLAAPVQVWSGRDGTIDPTGVRGVLSGDFRVLRCVDVEVSDESGPVEQAWLTTDSPGGGTTVFVQLLRVAAPGADPLVSLTRTRSVTPETVREDFEVASALPGQRFTVRLGFVPDATGLNQIKAGLAGDPVVPREGATWSWNGPQTQARLDLPGAVVAQVGERIVASWTVDVAPGRPASLSWTLHLRDDTGPFVGSSRDPLPVPEVNGSDDLRRLVARSVADLNALRLAERADPDSWFVAAGAPWFLTLFGRDSLIAARMCLPIGTDLALGTLRTLAVRQGSVRDVDRAEEPGKILHEVRAATLDLLQGTVLPPEYYGTIDATPLWICLLEQTWTAGAPDAVIAGFLDPLLAALGWLADFSDPDHDGFLEYFDFSGHGLVNQGWKDSGDSMRFADGRIAVGPIALAEVQGYAYQAARAGSRLLAHVGRTMAERQLAQTWDDYADAMAQRFRERFWVSDELGSYPAIALDRDKQPITGVASNMGHLLGTGMLTEDEVATVVRRLLHPSMFTGYGIRTMSTTNGAYWPTRYHVGSVWTHDTALVIEGLLAQGYPDQAKLLADGLLRAGEGFGFQLPELFGGQDASELYPPAPYPAACRPQAWAAASAITIARALGAL